MKWPYLEGFWTLSPPNMAQFANILTRGRPLIRQRHSLTNFQNQVLKRKRDVPKFDGFGPFFGPIYTQKTQNIAKSQNFLRNYIFISIK